MVVGLPARTLYGRTSAGIIIILPALGWLGGGGVCVGGGGLMSHVDFKKYACPMKLNLQFSCRI